MNALLILESGPKRIACYPEIDRWIEDNCSEFDPPIGQFSSHKSGHRVTIVKTVFCEKNLFATAGPP